MEGPDEVEDYKFIIEPIILFLKFSPARLCKQVEAQGEQKDSGECSKTGDWKSRCSGRTWARRTEVPKNRVSIIF